MLIFVVDGCFFVSHHFPNKSYDEYIKENQAGIAYFECFAPIWSDEIFNKFQNADGTIDIEAIENTDPELLKLISYRIPTEAKYSTAPLKIIGFLPREAGDAIMLPYEITTINDSDFDIDKDYIMRKNLTIIRKRPKEIGQALFEMLQYDYPRKELKKAIYEVVNNPDDYRDIDDEMYSEIWDCYKKVAYKTKAPLSGKTYRDNKIVDMTWAVLTHETSVSQVLNPGGFDNLKQIAYRIAAFKSESNNESWEELQDLGISALKDLYYTEKDLTFIDTQVQFYKQNSAASSLIGIFAVAKTAQAILQHDHLMMDLPKFTIAGRTFEGLTPVYPVHNADNELLGKILGSCVAASADAVKDPILDLVNINLSTVNIFIAMLNLGISEDVALMLLSQDVITKVLQQYNSKNLNGFTSLNSAINDEINTIIEANNITSEDKINKEDLTIAEMIEGLKSGVHPEIDYKVLNIFQKIQSIADYMRGPTLATRFNSISSAVGPLIVDNLYTENRMDKFTIANEDSDTGFYNEYGDMIDIYDILANHPILENFSKTLDIAHSLFKDMPAGSNNFKAIMRDQDNTISNVLYKHRDLLLKFSDFYQSYLAIASGLINPKALKNFVERFPDYFINNFYKERYRHNALIRAITFDTYKKTGHTWLKINTVGMDESEKDKLRYAWADLHKMDDELSTYLFNYNFFMGGIGFSPKTFMNLVPMYVKERLRTVKEDGTVASYLDTYRHFPEVSVSLLVDQFVRNNYTDGRLVPYRSAKKYKFMPDYQNSAIVYTDVTAIDKLRNTPYLRTYFNKAPALFKQVLNKEGMLVYIKVSPLGNNKEYIEISTEDIKTPINELPVKGDPTNDNDDSTVDKKKKEELQKAFIDAMLNTDINKEGGRLKSKEAALTLIGNIKKNNPKRFLFYLQDVFKKLGIEVNENNVENEFNKFC